MPEIRTSTGGVWRMGDKRYPSYVSFYKEPLVRVKPSADGKTLLAIACNPHDQAVQSVLMRLPGQSREYAFELVGDFPIIRRFPVTP